MCPSRVSNLDNDVKRLGWTGRDELEVVGTPFLLSLFVFFTFVSDVPSLLPFLTLLERSWQPYGSLYYLTSISEEKWTRKRWSDWVRLVVWNVKYKRKERNTDKSILFLTVRRHKRFSSPHLRWLPFFWEVYRQRNKLVLTGHHGRRECRLDLSREPSRCPGTLRRKTPTYPVPLISKGLIRSLQQRNLQVSKGSKKDVLILLLLLTLLLRLLLVFLFRFVIKRVDVSLVKETCIWGETVSTT